MLLGVRSSLMTSCQSMMSRHNSSYVAIKSYKAGASSQQLPIEGGWEGG